MLVLNSIQSDIVKLRENPKDLTTKLKLKNIQWPR